METLKLTLILLPLFIMLSAYLFNGRKTKKGIILEMVSVLLSLFMFIGLLVVACLSQDVFLILISCFLLMITPYQISQLISKLLT